MVELLWPLFPASSRTILWAGGTLCVCSVSVNEVNNILQHTGPTYVMVVLVLLMYWWWIGPILLSVLVVSSLKYPNIQAHSSKSRMFCDTDPIWVFLFHFVQHLYDFTTTPTLLTCRYYACIKINNRSDRGSRSITNIVTSNILQSWW